MISDKSPEDTHDRYQRRPGSDWWLDHAEDSAAEVIEERAVREHLARAALFGDPLEQDAPNESLED